MFTVYEVFPDGKKFFRYSDVDRFNCEVYVDHHICDYTPRRGLSKLIIEEE